MSSIRNLLTSFILVTVALGGNAAADTKADPAAPPPASSYSYGVLESIAPVPAGADARTADVDDPTATGEEAEKTKDKPPRLVFRVRLDDGRYQGFHQFGGDELRVGDRVQIESDRLRRAPDPDPARK
jgi:hypothetical protein